MKRPLSSSTPPVVFSLLQQARRRGVALILTLGILSLLLLMAMSFAFDARTGRQVAVNNASLTLARLLLNSGIQRGVSVIRTLNSMNAGTEHFYWPPSGNWAGRGYIGSVNATSPVGSDSPFYVRLNSTLDFTPGSTLDPNLGWIYVYTSRDHSSNGSGGPANSDSVIARYAYLIVDETGKIDPNAAISSVAETNGTDSGIAYNEINLANAFTGPMSGTADEFRTLLNPPTVPVWSDWIHIANGGFTNLAGSMGEGLQSLYPSSYDIEAWNDNPGAGGTDKHRFNLARSDWDSVTVAQVTAAAANFWSGSGSTVAPNTSGIPWIANSPRAQTIAANLIDYCDSDSIATSDIATNNPPTYTGNEKTPYINEFLVQVKHIEVDPDGTSGSGDEYSRLEVTLWPELVNIYDTDLGNGGTLTVELALNSTESGAQTLNFSWTLAADVTARQYVQLAGDTQNYNHGSLINPFTSITVQLMKIRLNSPAGGGWDFAQTAISPVCAKLRRDTAPPSLDPVTQDIDFSVNDPRYNLPAAQWTDGGWRLLPNGTLGEKNTACAAPAAGVGNDDEVGNYMGDGAGGANPDVTNISTAYIRNGPMQSLWELGAIHRAAPWQTINLHGYDDTGGTGIDAGGNDYTKGDANILDQVKLSDATIVRGKFNPNSGYDLAWRGLLGHVKYGSSYENCGYDGTALDPTWSASHDIYDMVKHATKGVLATSNPHSAVPGALFIDRGEIAAVPYFVNGGVVAQSTDKAQEEIVGKIANYLSTRQNYYTIIVTAQALKDLGAVSAVTGSFSYDGGTHYAITTAEQRALAVVYRDAFTNKFRIERIISLSE